MIGRDNRLKVLKKLEDVLPGSSFDTTFLRLFGHFKIPLLSYIKPKVQELNDEQIKIVVPLRRRSRNHLNSMYFGAIMIGADCAAGYYAAKLIFSRGYKIDFVFKSAKAEFLKRPTGDVQFLVRQGQAITNLVELAEASGERQELDLEVECSCPDVSEETVALVHLVLSIKRRRKNS